MFARPAASHATAHAMWHGSFIEFQCISPLHTWCPSRLICSAIQILPQIADEGSLLSQRRSMGLSIIGHRASVKAWHRSGQSP